MKKQRKQKEWNQIFTILTSIFLLFLMGVYPLFQMGSYATLFKAKTGFLYVGLLVFGFAYIIALVVTRRNAQRPHTARPEGFVLADYGVLAFMCVSMLSWLGNDHKTDLFWGSYGRNVGLLVVLCCGAIYFACSRFGEWKQGIILTMLLAMVLVVFVEVCNHLGLDIFNMYADLKDRNRMLSTLGNLTVLTSYLALILPISMGLFLIAQEELSKKIYGVISFVGFLGMFAAGTDGAYLITAVLLFVALVVAKENAIGSKWCVLVAEMSLAALFLRLLRGCASETSMELESQLTSWMLENDVAFFVLLILFVVMIAFSYYLHRRKERWAQIRTCLLVGCVLGMVIVIVGIIVLNCVLDETIAKEAFGGFGQYLYFDDVWGTKRLQIWKMGVIAFSNMSIFEKCLGYGPSGFYFALQELVSGEVVADTTVSGILVDAHSVYLQLLVGQGIIGLLCYLTAFVGGICKCKFTCEKNAQVLIYILWLASFLTQAIVNNIHIYTEPLCFAMLGMWMKNLCYEKE